MFIEINNLSLNIKKTLLFHTINLRNLIQLTVMANEKEIENEKNLKLLGLHMDANVTWIK